MEAIVLAGGFGTRLSHIVADVPKPMAPVNNRPFLEYLFDYLGENGVTHIVLAIGYKGNVIRDYFGCSYKDIRITYSVETSPLGTGGAIKKALKVCSNRDVFIVNGDTYFNVDLYNMREVYVNTESHLTLAVKLMSDFDRYGSVEICDGKILKFKEKTKTLEGKINGGIYLLNKSIFDSVSEEVFSFEEIILENTGKDIFAYESEGYFIDIGVPDDYEKVQRDFMKMRFINE